MSGVWSLADPLFLALLPAPLLAAWLLGPAHGVSGGGALTAPGVIGARLAASEGVGLGARGRAAAPVVLWIGLVLALAGPQKLAPSPALPASSRDIVLALDLSGSMDNRDFDLDGQEVSRLDAVKRVAAAFVRRRAGDRVGLVIFAETAYFAAPPTYDVEAVARAVEQASIGVTGRSTAISDGLGLALKRLQSSAAPSRVIILLSDGVDTSGSVDPLGAAALAGALGVRVHSIALGPREISAAERSRDAVDAETLRRIAETSGGTAFRVRATEDLRAVTRAIDALEGAPLEGASVEIERPYWPYPAGVAWLAAMAMLLLGRGRA